MVFHICQEEIGAFINMKEGRGLQQKTINLLIIDVDGTLTDGGMYYDDQGHEWKKFNTRDGKGIELLREHGIATMILTSEDTPIVSFRAKKLKVEFCYMGIKDKKAKLDSFFQEHIRYAYETSAYIGDDVNDVAAMKCVAFSAVPADGAENNKEVADYICQHKGGEGCVREVCERLIKKIREKKLELSTVQM